LRFSTATLLARIIAVTVDALLVLCVMLVTLMVWMQKSLGQIQAMVLDEMPGSATELTTATGAALFAGAAVPFLYAMQVARQGTTPGKAVMKISVRNLTTGAFPNYRRALGREALRFAHVMPLLLPAEVQLFLAAGVFLVMIDMSRNRLCQTWYDRLMRTVIVTPVVERQE
jgi:hypothetical protein